MYVHTYIHQQGLLDHDGIDPLTKNWTSSFLSNWSQRVVINREGSEAVPVTSGVPQGSVLTPILFLLFINDLPEYTGSSQFRLFADDAIIYLTISSTDDCNRLQDYFKKLEQWEKYSLLVFHPAKCNILCITRKRSKIIHPYTLHGKL